MTVHRPGSDRRPADPVRPTRTERARAPVAALFVLPFLLAAAGCSLDVQEPKQVPWEATLEAVQDSLSLEGSSAAVAKDETTELGIDLRGGQEGQRWVWRLAQGSCSSPAGVIGDADTYPILEAQQEEITPSPGAPPITVIRATGQTLLPESLLEDNDYHVRVAAEDSPDVTLACGNLRPS